MVDESEKKTGDLTALSDLGLTEEKAFGTTLENVAPPALEGMDDFLNPMSPTEIPIDIGGEPQTEPLSETALLDPIASLPPVDGDTLAAAEGRNEPLSLAPDEAERLPPLEVVPEEFKEELPIRAAIAASLSPPTSMESVRIFSDQLAPAATPETLHSPYSLVIEGALRPHERETLLGILSRESLGVREIELEPQFQAGHILIPRISEYAGVLIVQSLRNAQAKIRLGPSERIFVSPESEDGDRLIRAPNSDAELLITEEGCDSSAAITLTTAETVPGKKLLSAIDTLHTSMNLKATHLAQPQSPIFQDAIEKLKKQLKSQAHHRGAHALVAFKYTLLPLEGQTVFKLVAEARAVRFEQ